MSRIDEALRRARDGAAAPSPETPTGAGVATEPDATEQVFVSPWEFEAAAQAGAEPGNGSPAWSGQTPVLDTSLAPTPGGLPADGEVPEKLLGSGRMPGRAFEQYRRLGATLHQAQIEKSIRVVMVTSAVAGEGKSLTAANVAMTLGTSYGRNTLLIDADLRRPALHTLFQVPNVSGLSDGLRDGGTHRLSVQRISPRLSLLTSGRPEGDPTGLLSSESMRRVVEEAATTFDWVVIDTPPVGLLTDARLLAGMVDTVLFVVQAASTPYDVVRRAVEAVGKERILGVVLNRAEDPGPLGKYGKYGKYYHYDYYEQGGEAKKTGRR